MNLKSMEEMVLLNEIQILKGKLNLASELVREIRHELTAEEFVNIEEEINWEKIEEVRNYAADLSDFLRIK